MPLQHVMRLVLLFIDSRVYASDTIPPLWVIVKGMV